MSADKHDAQLLTATGRKRLEQAYQRKTGQSILACERGFWDNTEGFSYSDSEMIELVIRCGIDIAQALSTAHEHEGEFVSPRLFERSRERYRLRVRSRNEK